MAYAIQRFHTAIREMMPSEAGRVLEVGCGEGFSAKAVLDGRANITAFGGDLSEQAVHEAAARFPPMKYNVMDATRLPFKDNAVDLVFSLEVLEHLPHADQALKEYARVSRRWLLLSVPNDAIFRALRLASGKGLTMWGDHPEHVNHWGVSGFKGFVQRHGLNIRRVTVPFPFVWTIILCEK
jgi:SAM-dependent methyltransferase